jgi:hypothetical protein
MIQYRPRVAKWPSITPAVGVCTPCSGEPMVPVSALKRTSDARASLPEQFDAHKCEAEDADQAVDVLLRQEPDEEEDEEEDDGKRDEDDDNDDDDQPDGGYSE